MAEIYMHAGSKYGKSFPPFFRSGDWFLIPEYPPINVVYYDEVPTWKQWFNHVMYATAGNKNPTILPEDRKMPTQEQKDKVYEAAVEYERSYRGVGLSPEGQRVCDAVRAAEQPAWRTSVNDSFVWLWHRDEAFMRASLTSSRDRIDTLERIARLLNEDDAKGGK